MEPPRPRSSGFAAPRRVFTAPVPPAAPLPASSPQSAGGLVDTLYDHPNVKIVSFTATPHSLSVGPRATTGSDIEPGSLPWSTQLERTIAVGPFRIYRAPGSVAFLSCGSALQPILPKSQAWCVDEESSKFVLQVRRPQYWRIEVPVEDQEEILRAQQLRHVFDAILQFEKTECPFQRSFTVELPERPQTPVKKRPWTPVRRSSASLPLRPATPVEIARLHKGTPRGSICMGDLRTPGDTRKALSEHIRGLEPPTEESVLRESDETGSTSKPRGNLAPPTVLVQAEKFQGGSPVAPPRQTAMAIASRSEAKEAGPVDVPRFKPLTTPLESLQVPDSWRSTPLPPSPPLSNPGSPLTSSLSLPSTTQTHTLPETPVLQQDTFDHAITSKPSLNWSIATADSLPSSECSAATARSTLDDLECSPTRKPSRPTSIVETPAPQPEESLQNPSPARSTTSPSPSPRGRRPPVRRATTSSSISPSRRALSPLPSAANLFSPRHHHLTTTNSPNATAALNNTNPSGALATITRRLPLTTVLHKTCEILMSPPSHLLNLMLKVAARIAAGEWRGLVFGMGEAGERVSVAWDWSEEQQEVVSGRSERGGGWRWGVGSDGAATGSGNGEEDWWLRRRRGEGEKMAGSFPESDEEEEEEEGVGPLDGLRRERRSRSRSLGRDGKGVDGNHATGQSPDYPGSDAEWGVD